MNHKELRINTWLRVNTALVTCVIRGHVHRLVIDYFDEMDHLDFINDLDEYLIDVLQIAIGAAKQAQVAAALAQQQSSWNLVSIEQLAVDDGEDTPETDETLLLKGSQDSSFIL